MQTNQYKHNRYTQDDYLSTVLIIEVLEAYAQAFSFMPRKSFKHLHSCIQEFSMYFDHNNVFRLIYRNPHTKLKNYSSIKALNRLNQEEFEIL